MRENTTPSNRVSPKYPSLIRHARRASQCPVIGRALNWQGQPQLQLQFATSSPAIRHEVFVGWLILLLLHSRLLPGNGNRRPGRQPLHLRSSDSLDQATPQSNGRWREEEIGRTKVRTDTLATLSQTPL